MQQFIIRTTDEVVMHVHYGFLLMEVNPESDFERSLMLLYGTGDNVADEERG